MGIFTPSTPRALPAQDPLLAFHPLRIAADVLRSAGFEDETIAAGHAGGLRDDSSDVSPLEFIATGIEGQFRLGTRQGLSGYGPVRKVARAEDRAGEMLDWACWVAAIEDVRGREFTLAALEAFREKCLATMPSLVAQRFGGA